MSEQFSIVREDQFIQATRDSGYKGTDSALSELVDNALQAKANQIAIRMVPASEEPQGPGRPRQPRVAEVGIADNGRGMDVPSLRRALRFGDGSRFGDRTGLGRFGMGLPNASVSQCQRFEVFSWQRGQTPLFSYVDVNEVASGRMQEIPEPIEQKVPRAYDDLVTGPNGTLVIWKSCDRLDHDGRVDTLLKSLRHSLGRMFRYFLAADLQLSINGFLVEPFDPLYLMPATLVGDGTLGTKHGDTIKLEVPIPGSRDQTSTVEIMFSLLPEAWQINYHKDREERRKRFIDGTVGFSMVRHGREVDLIKNPYLARHWVDAWYRVEVRFEPELDEIFEVTHTKQHARIPKGSAIFERLQDIIRPNVYTLISAITARAKKAHESRPKRAEEAAQKVQPRLKPLEALDEKPSEIVQHEIQQFVENQRIAKGIPELEAESLEERLNKYEILVEFESLPGAPFYRAKTVGRAIIVLVNSDHAFYEKVYRRLENDSPVAKTGIELMLMTLARAEILGSDDSRDWYEDQRQEWSQHLKVFLSQLDDIDPDEERGAQDDAV